MGKSFNHNKNQFSEKNESRNDFKRRKNHVREEHIKEEWSEYQIRGFNRNTKNN